MGCDIHSVAQIKRGGKWITVRQDIAGDNRDYDTFGALANVRNGSGFAGVDTGDGFLSLCEPRGLPSDFQHDGDYNHKIKAGTPTGETYEWAEPKARKKYLAEIAAETNAWMGDHSHSFATLEELRKHAERLQLRKTKKRGIITAEEFEAWDHKPPKSYCGGISGGGVVNVVKAKDYKPGNASHVQVEWTVNQLEQTNLSGIISDLATLADQYGCDDDQVRYVFGFDS